MARSAVADEVHRREREEQAALTPAERVRLAFELHDEAVTLYCAMHGTSREQASRLLSAERRRGRTPSKCMDEPA